MKPGSPDSTSQQHTDTTHSSYIHAFKDTEFLERDELRPIRIGLELLKPELIQREEEIHSTIVVFGSARSNAPSRKNFSAPGSARPCRLTCPCRI